jgi:hypothetical protein
MAAEWQRVAKLDEVLQRVTGYENKQRLRSDIADLFKRFFGLQPQYQTFSTYGRSTTLFFLSGTVPCTIQGTTYNIPVTIYFDPPYPRQAPRCFVTPAEGMAINQSHENVNASANGVITLPCLSNWSQYNSTLTNVVETMAYVFSQKSPVYATTGAPRSQQQQQQQQQPAFQGTQGYASGTPIAVATPIVQPTQATPVVRAQPVTPQVDPRQAAIQELTEQARARWPVVVGEIVEDINGQQRKKVDLQEHADVVAAELKSLQEKVNSNREKQQELEAMARDLQAFVEAHAGREPNPDDVADELDPESKNVLDLLSEELAIEEYLMSLDQLLEARQISMDTFLTEVREQSREQFKLKYQRQKAARAVRAAAQARATGQPIPQAQVVSVPQRIAVAA